MGVCAKCGKTSNEIAQTLSLCAACIPQADSAMLSRLEQVHRQAHAPFGLEGIPPRAADGIVCGLCVNQCRIAPGKTGYCGVRRNENGALKGGTANEAAVSWSFDELPTNCVADWVCPGGTGTGYPKFTHKRRAERGYFNLAVFYEACSFDCLFCQNWQYKNQTAAGRPFSAHELAEDVTDDTACICFFGGDPACQLPHALALSQIARQQRPGKILRICWETNGSMVPQLLDKMLDLSLESGGCVKFDLKAIDKNLHFALCGVDNSRTLDNFKAAAGRIAERPDPPPLIASTLLVPGYIDDQEVGALASFIAEQNPDIPYALLGFGPDFMMSDLPPTSWAQAKRCLSAAKAAGLTRVRLGNIHLLS